MGMMKNLIAVMHRRPELETGLQDKMVRRLETDGFKLYEAVYILKVEGKSG